MSAKLCFLFIFAFSQLCYSFQTLCISDDYLYEVYEPEDMIPIEFLEMGLEMYQAAYSNPRIHEKIPLKEMNIDEAKFHSYEEFIADMFNRDFQTYQNPGLLRRHYFQVWFLPTRQIVGICAVIEQERPGFYHIDHIGIDHHFRNRGLASHLIEEIKNMFPSFLQISLDTRVFNHPAQALYEKKGFKKLEVNPIPEKQSTYFYFVLEGQHCS